MIHTAVLVLKFLINLRFKQLGDIPNRIIENSKIRNLYIARLLFIKTEIKQVYNPYRNHTLHLLYSIIFFVR